MPEHPRVVHDHRIVPAGGDRLDQLRMPAAWLAGVGVDGRCRPAQVPGRTDHPVTLHDHAGVTGGGGIPGPDVGRGPGRSTAHAISSLNAGPGGDVRSWARTGRP